MRIEPSAARIEPSTTGAVPAAETADVAVVGGGPVGLTAAIAIAKAGVDTILVAPAHAVDHRTTALLAGSVEALERLGVFSHCRDFAAPLAAIRIVDDRGGILRAPEVRFEAREIGLEAFGYNIENQRLLAGLARRVAELPALRHIKDLASAVAPEFGSVRVHTPAAAVRAKLVVGADGVHSASRTAAGIAEDGWAYPQTALACNLRIARTHGNVSTEFHTAEGPFTLVPLPGLRASLVWVMHPERAERMRVLDDGELALAVERQAHSIFGKVEVEPGRSWFPLSGFRAQRLAANRVALVGEAAHVLPPIGAQGLNLGLRDALQLADLLASAHAGKDDLGSAELLERYDALRRADVSARRLAVDLLNRSLLSDLLPAQALRAASLFALDRIAPLRRAMMREGVFARFGAGTSGGGAPRIRTEG